MQSPPPAAPASGTSIGSVAAPGTGGRFEVASSDCSDAGCALVVRIGGSRRPPTGTAKLDWQLPAGPVRVAPAASAASALEQRAQRWQLGAEEQTAHLMAIPVDTGPAQVALLLQVEAGFEHVKRRHALLTVVGEALTVAWKREDGEGPHKTGVMIAKSKNQEGQGQERLVYFDAFLEPSPQAVDTLSVRVLTPDEGAPGKMRESSPAEAGVEVPAVLVGRFANATEARRARAEMPCLADTLALPASAFAGGRGRGIVLARVPAFLAEAAAREVSSCTAGKHPVRVDQMRTAPGPAPGKKR